MTDFVVVIPARISSTRLDRKVLADISGRPMVVRVAERARASGASRILVATDSDEIRTAVEAAGFESVMTGAHHVSGTDRIAEAVRRLEFDSQTIVVNVQGDEPLIEPGLINSVAARLETDPSAAMATACSPIRESREMFNPNVVKVVLDAAGRACYFSRSPIPYARDAFANGVPPALPEGLPCYRHVGIYAYRVRSLMTYTGLAPVLLEKYEALEQLRALYHGLAIAVLVTNDSPVPGVDTAEDLERVRRLLSSGD